MAHITLSIPDEIYQEMKNHPEIKWSNIARERIVEKILSLKIVISSRELLNLLNKDIRDSIEKTNQKEAASFYKEIKKGEEKRKKYLTLA